MLTLPFCTAIFFYLMRLANGASMLHHYRKGNTRSFWFVVNAGMSQKTGARKVLSIEYNFNLQLVSHIGEGKSFFDTITQPESQALLEVTYRSERVCWLNRIAFHYCDVSSP